MDEPLELFAVQRLYALYGHDVYARAAADPGFSAAISDHVAWIREDLERGGPRTAGLLSRKTTLNAYLLGHAHAVVDCLVEAAMRPGGESPAAADPDFVAVRLGAMFHLAFDGGLLRLPAQADAPPSAR
ncbi:DUF6401 family natural product biosynthesis protein [Nonomuraea aridisoli]|uniref:Uncharacterized protein n=1 Tax=Nonomuraea aridisoli TaxID=2070368 RepID=A0A2W2E7B1_9ACTN|nr:DUF6401 family natural product biosynthesis protein [Nonomuraea aridisoli]PZG19942.1 hypothetical protein C1J01_10935 [Nonomuraea aridisoli]